MARLRPPRTLLLAVVFASGCASVPRASILSVSRGLGLGPDEVVVAPGETACALAGRLGVDVRALRTTNALNGPAAQPVARARVQVPAEAPLRHRVRPGETLDSLASWYGHPTATLAA